jgi:exosome complex RNA-binding protein Rrp4
LLDNIIIVFVSDTKEKSMNTTKTERGVDIESLPLRIVIGQRGWVWVGRYERVRSLERDQFDYVNLYNAFCIRSWGTKTGLGQLENGPAEETVLDPCPTIRLHELTVVATYDVNDAEWMARTLIKS